jgi:Zn-dependent peptidase ImmA (M78 family)
VLPHGELGANEAAEHFRGAASKSWSGMCIPCDGMMLIVYNDSHPPRRTRATLMEEFFHLWLGHRPSRLKVFSNGESKRDFDRAKESEAYGSGAAALVPYQPLRAMLQKRDSVHAIADHFLVSEQLVEFRIRICKLTGLRRK